MTLKSMERYPQIKRKPQYKKGVRNTIIILLICILMVMTAKIVFPVIKVKRQLDMYAEELCRTVETAGRVDIEAAAKIRELSAETGLNPEIHWSRIGVIQKDEAFTVRLTCTSDLVLRGGFKPITITLTSEAAGRSKAERES